MGEKIKLTLEPASSAPAFYWDGTYESVHYSQNAAGFIASNNKFGELSGVGLDVLLAHEIGHSPVAAAALGYSYSKTFKWSNEFDVVRNVENPYRSAIAQPLRQTYGGAPIPPPIKQ